MSRAIMNNSTRSADAVVGMMDASYFVGRKELLDFFNDKLQLNLTKIEQTASGAIACQICDMIFPDSSIPMSKVHWTAKTDYEYIQNYKLLQKAFTKHRVQRHVDVEKLIRAKYQDNLEFCQWLKAFYDQSGRHNDEYDPAMVRARGKGGVQYNKQMGRSGRTGAAAGRGRSGASSSTSRPPAVMKNKKSTTTSTTKAAVSTVASSQSSDSNKAAAAHNRFSRPLRERSTPPEANNGGGSDNSGGNKNQNNEEHKEGPTNNDDDVVEQQPMEDDNEEEEEDNKVALLIELNAELENENKEMQIRVVELENAVVDTEKERDFYFEKLRNVEVMLQVFQEKQGTMDETDLYDDDGDDKAANINHLLDNVFKVLYATTDDKLTINDDGEVVDGEVSDSLADSV